MAPICPSSCSFIGFEIPLKDTSLRCKTEHDALCPRVYRFAAWLTVQAVPLISSIRLLFLAFRPKPHSENPSFQFCQQQTSKYALSFEVYLHRSLGLLCFTLGVGMAVVTCPISYTSQSKNIPPGLVKGPAFSYRLQTLCITSLFHCAAATFFYHQSNGPIFNMAMFLWSSIMACEGLWCIVFAISNPSLTRNMARMPQGLYE